DDERRGDGCGSLQGRHGIRRYRDADPGDHEAPGGDRGRARRERRAAPSATGPEPRAAARARELERRPKTCVLGRIRTRAWSAGGTHHLHVAAGKAGATAWARSAHVPTWHLVVLPVQARVVPRVPCVPRQLCWPRHGARACHRRFTLALPLRPKTESWVGYLRLRRSASVPKPLLSSDFARCASVSRRSSRSTASFAARAPSTIESPIRRFAG